MMKLLLTILALVAVALAQDSISDRYLKSVSQVRKQLMLIDTEYEMFKEINQQNNKEIVNVINKIKHNKEELGLLKSEVGLILATLKTYKLVDQLFLEYVRILCDAYSNALNQIAFEILAFQADIFEFKKTYISESINIEANLMKAEVEKLIVKLVDVDTRMANIMNKTNHEKNPFNEALILADLSYTSNDALNMKVRMYELLMRETEVAHQENKELNILQQADMDSSVTVLSFMFQFIKTDYDLVLRLLGR